ncbi:MAG: helix-turn-helix domain-containing protein [Acidimicrobiales bacterium]
MNHLMNGMGGSGREAQKRATRERIVRAVAELVADGHPAAVSVPAVAERAGVGVATVYRYFPTKEALLDASAMVLGDDAKLTSLEDFPQSFAEVTTILPDQFEAIARQIPLTRNQLASPLGRQLRQRRWQAKQQAMTVALRGSGIDPDSEPGRRFAAIADVLTSSTAVLELHDKAGIPIDEAANHVLWALAVLERATHRASTRNTKEPQ